MSCRTIALCTFIVGLYFFSATAADNPPAPATDHGVLPTAPAPTAAEQRIKAMLDLKVSIDVADQPLSEWLSYLSDKYHVPIQFDVNGLRDAAIDPSTTPVGVQVNDISLRSALKLVLSEHNLTYLLKDEILLVTTTDKANACLMLCIYDVRDLVSDANNAVDGAAVSQLTTVITNTLASPTWNTSGGPATIQPFGHNGICVLVISQTQEVHEQIEQLLADLRTFKPQRKT
jgi:hypothetical protein